VRGEEGRFILGIMIIHFTSLRLVHFDSLHSTSLHFIWLCVCFVRSFREDPSENNDLMDDPSPSPEVKQLLEMMETKYKDHCSTFFQSTHIFADEQHNEHQNCEMKQAYIDAHKGFDGPFCT
jgi:hypothetical protein